MDPQVFSQQWATGRKVWQGTVTPSRRRTPGSIPGSPTIFEQIEDFSKRARQGFSLKKPVRAQQL